MLAPLFSWDNALRTALRRKPPTWLDAVQSQLQSIVDSPDSHSLSAKKDNFPHVIRKRLIVLGSCPRYRPVFALKNETVYVLTVLDSEQNRLSEGNVGANA